MYFPKYAELQIYFGRSEFRRWNSEFLQKQSRPYKSQVTRSDQVNFLSKSIFQKLPGRLPGITSDRLRETFGPSPGPLRARPGTSPGLLRKSSGNLRKIPGISEQHLVLPPFWPGLAPWQAIRNIKYRTVLSWRVRLNLALYFNQIPATVPNRNLSFRPE